MTNADAHRPVLAAGLLQRVRRLGSGQGLEADARGLASSGRRSGFESIWTGEHVTSKWGGPGSTAFDVWVMTTAIAALVPNVEIGFCVVNSTFHNPALTAKMAATLDVITDGRVVLGLGAGLPPDRGRHASASTIRRSASGWRSWASTSRS